MKQCNINIMLDSGSTHTIVNEKIAEKLGARKLNKTTILIENSHGEEEYEADMVEINLSELTLKAYSIDTDLVALDVNESLITKLWPNLDSHILKEVLRNAYKGRTHMIVGQDNHWRFELMNMITHKDKRAGLIQTKFGWSMSGDVSSSISGWPLNSNQKDPIKIVNQTIKLKEIEDSLYKLFNIDEEVVSENNYSYEEEYAVNLFKRTIKREPDGRYAIQPLFKKHSVPLKNNFYLALVRYRALMRSLRRHPDRLQTYNEALKKMLDNDEIEEVIENPQESKRPDKNLFYIPHSAVVKPERLTTTIRVVFDASASNSEGHSLNGQLLEGPKLQLDITSLLIQLRLKKIVLIADISRMFYNIAIQEPFRDYYRFLWNFNTEQDEPKIYRFKAVLMGASDSPFLAIATIHHHLDEVVKSNPNKKWITDLIRNHLYVDDFLVSVDTIEEAIILRREVTEIFSQMTL